MRKLVSAAVVLFVGYYLVTQPGPAADFVSQAVAAIRSGAEGLSTFVSSLS